MSPYCWLPVRRTGPHRFPGAGVSWVQTAWSSHRHVCKKCLLDAAEARFAFSKEEAAVYFVKWWKIRLGWFLLSGSLATRCGDGVVAAENCRVGKVGVRVTRNKPLCAVTLKDTGRGSCPLDWQHIAPPEEWPAGTYFLLQSPPPPGPGENDKVTWLFIPLCVVFKSLTYAN